LPCEEALSGIFSYDGEIRSKLTPTYLLTTPNGIYGWGTGLSGSRPSIWGNAEVIPTGATALPPSAERFQYFIIYTYTGINAITFDSEITLPRTTQNPRCSYSFQIATTEGRIDVTGPNATCSN